MPKKKSDKEPRKRRKATSNGASATNGTAFEAAGIPLRLKGQRAGNGDRLAVLVRGKA